MYLPVNPYGPEDNETPLVNDPPHANAKNFRSHVCL
jgi:hypothetical protein